MSQQYAKKGNTYWPQSADSAFPIFAKLPVGTYVLKFHPEYGFYFEPIEDFTLPSKLYGDLTDRTDRIITTFLDRESTTGVLLSGEKGSGKTLLAKNLAIELAKRYEIPTIVINAPYQGDGFNTLIQNLQQEAVFFFDEFEKVYNTDEDKTIQDRLLTLLDGVYTSKKLFILTTNDSWRINEHMKNRPGRLFYLINYKGLDANFVREYAEDNLKNKDHIEKLVNITALYKHFNFDMLKAIVEEMNRYNEPPKEALVYLNAQPDTGGEATYDIHLFVGGKEVPKELLNTTSIYINPLAGENDERDEDEGGWHDETFSVQIWPMGRQAWEQATGDWQRARKENPGMPQPNILEFRKEYSFGPADIQRVDGSKGAFIYEKEIDGKLIGLVLTERQSYQFDYSRLF